MRWYYRLESDPEDTMRFLNVSDRDEACQELSCAEKFRGQGAITLIEFDGYERQEWWVDSLGPAHGARIMTVAEINAAIMFAANEKERSYWRAELTEVLKGK